MRYKIICGLSNFVTLEGEINNLSDMGYRVVNMVTQPDGTIIALMELSDPHPVAMQETGPTEFKKRVTKG